MLHERHVHEASVLTDRAREVALVRERRRKTPVRREIRRSDGDGLEQQTNRARAVAGLGKPRRGVAQRRQGGADVLLCGLSARETAVRIDVAMLLDELAVCDLRGTRLAVRKELPGRVARETVSAARLLLGYAARGERRRELRRTFVAHRARGFRAHARDEGLELCGFDGVGVHAERVEFRREECLRSRPEVALGHTEQLLRKRVQSSPEVASSDNA